MERPQQALCHKSEIKPLKTELMLFFFHARLSDHQVSNPTAVAALEMKCLITDRSDWQQTAAPGNLEGLWRGSS